MGPIPVIINETWVPQKRTDLRDNEFFILEGYHSLTKERLHTYGPFEDEDDLKEFACLHGITLWE